MNFGIQASTAVSSRPHCSNQCGLSQWPESHLPVGPGPGKSENNFCIIKNSGIWNYVEGTLWDFLILPSRDHLSNVQTNVGCRSNPGHVERSKPHYYKYCGCRCCEPKNGNQNQKAACCANQWVIFRERLVQIAAQELAKICRDASYDPAPATTKVRDDTSLPLIRGGLLDKTRLQDPL